MGILSGWRFCPRCRTELRGDEARLECPACGLVAHASSKPTACAVVVGADGRVLLARRRGEPYAGYWDLPGGFLEEGEHPLDGLRRELREETGLAVEPGRFIGIWMDRYGSGDDAEATLNLYWEAHTTGGDPVATDDITEVAWFDPDAFPPAGELAFHIADVLRAWRSGGQAE